MVSKSANFFFFVDNFSEWNIYYRKRYNEEWIKRFGKLTKKEKVALKNYRLIMQKYEKFGIPKKIRRCFYQKSDNIKVSFKKIHKILNKDEVNTLENSFNILQLRFEKMWEENEMVLNQNKKAASLAYKKLSKKIGLIYFNLKSFYGDKSSKTYLFNIYLIISPSRGGKAIDKNIISIETGNLDLKKKNQFIEICFSIMHELAHARFENKKYKNWVKKFIENKNIPKSELMKERSAREVLREIITDLTKVALHSLLKKEDFKKINNYEYKKDLKKISDLGSLEKLIRQELSSTIERYFLTQKKIDIDFLEKCWNLIEKYS